MTKAVRDHGWYLREWAGLRGKRQSDLVNELGWLKPRASKVWNGAIPYRKDMVEELSAWLGVQTFELLMPPEDAIALRRLREIAGLIVSGDTARNDTTTEPTPKPRIAVVGR